jgi:dsDNA-binding SOS-regulon protein
MAVITKFVVVRNGVELDKEFLVKKEAEAYDRMLDAAENLAGYIRNAGLEIEADDRTIDAIAIFLAQNGPEVTRILKGLKPTAAPVKSSSGKEKQKDGAVKDDHKAAPSSKTNPKSK